MTKTMKSMGILAAVMAAMSMPRKGIYGLGTPETLGNNVLRKANRKRSGPSCMAQQRISRKARNRKGYKVKVSNSRKN